MSDQITESSQESKPVSDDGNPMLVRLAIGAVLSSIVSFSLGPVLTLLPSNGIIGDFFDGVVLEAVQTSVIVGGTILISRIRTIDRLLSWYLRMTMLLPVLLAIAVWLNAGVPFQGKHLFWGAFLALAVFLFFAYCGWLGSIAVLGMSENQRKEATILREKQFNRLKEEWTAKGDPGKAVEMLALDWNIRIARFGCLIAGLLIAGALIFVILMGAVAGNAVVLYNIRGPWGALLGAIVALAALGLIPLSHKIGERFSEQIPLSEKGMGIVDDDDLT